MVAHISELWQSCARGFSTRRQDGEKERLKDTKDPTSVVGKDVSEECHGEGFFETNQSTC